MIQGNYSQHWVTKEFTDIKTMVDKYFANPNETRSIVETYNEVFSTKLDINFMENDPIIKSYFTTTSRDTDKASTPNELVFVLTNKSKINQNSSNEPEINTMNANSESIQKVINADVSEETLKLNQELQTDIRVESFANQDELKQFIIDSISTIVVSLTRKIEELENKISN